MGSCEFQVVSGGVGVVLVISDFLANGWTLGVNQFKGFTINFTFAKR